MRIFSRVRLEVLKREWFTECMIVKRTDGYYVLSEKRRNLGGPYKTREEAKKRLRQVEYFKHLGKR